MPMLPRLLLVAACLCLAVPAVSQPVSFRLDMAQVPVRISEGDVRFADAIAARGVFADAAASAPAPLPARTTGRKSPLLAGLLSAVVPGAGEVYAGSYLLAGLFAGLEVGGWVANAHYNSLGDERTTQFQNYADAHWSVVKYAEWLNANAKNFEGGDDRLLQIAINPDATLPPWQRVDWETMNRVELAIPKFSHRLPPHGDQQYFEMIGKYNQYSYGWEDKLSGDYYDISARFRDYSTQRGHANDAYNTASLFVNLIVLNHVLSAVDAAWAAARANRDIELHSSVRVLTLPDGRAELMPTSQLRWRF